MGKRKASATPSSGPDVHPRTTHNNFLTWAVNLISNEIQMAERRLSLTTEGHVPSPLASPTHYLLYCHVKPPVSLAHTLALVVLTTLERGLASGHVRPDPEEAEAEVNGGWGSTACASSPDPGQT